MGRAPCCDKANVKKGPWSPEEDAKLKSYIEQNGTGGNWIALPQKIGLKRCGKSCRLRWLNYLRPNIKHGGFSEEEDRIICSLYSSIGSRWSIIAGQLPGRTDNDIKNYWNTRLKKKLLGKQRKEQSGRKSKRLVLSDHHHNHNHNQINDYDIIAPPLPNLPANFTTQAMFPYSYWPPPIDPASGQLFSEDESMRTLLLKLDHHHQQQPQAIYYDDQQQDGLVNLHPPIISNGHDDHLVSSMLNLDNQMIAPPHLDDNNPTSFPPELEELMSSSVVSQGRDLFQGETSCGETTTSWFEMSSLISVPMVNNVSSHQLRYPGN